MIAVSCSVMYAPNVFADDQKYELKTAAATVKDVLAENMGKRVIVRMDTGDNLEGTVSKVGDSLVHISKISGKDFYDAVVRIDKISAVLFKVRGN
jgi:prefoldin subunit 5